MIKALSSLARFASAGATSWIKNLKIIAYQKENFHNLHISVSARNIGNLMTELRLLEGWKRKIFYCSVRPVEWERLLVYNILQRDVRALNVARAWPVLRQTGFLETNYIERQILIPFMTWYLCINIDNLHKKYKIYFATFRHFVNFLLFFRV